MGQDISNQNGSAGGGFILGEIWQVEPKLNRIYKGERGVQIPDKYMQVLMCLVERGGVVSREELMQAVWPDSYVVEESLTRAVSELRKIFGDDPRNPRFIETIPKKGYRLIADVRWQSSSESAGAPIADPPELQARGRGRWLIAAAASALILLTLGWRFFPPGEVPQNSASELRQLTSLQGREFDPALSPDGDRLAFVWDGGEGTESVILVMDVDRGQSIKLAQGDGGYGYPAWSPDGRSIAYASFADETGGIYIVPAAGGEAELIVGPEHGAWPTAPDFSPDGNWLVYACRAKDEGPYRIRLISLATGEPCVLSDEAEATEGDYRPHFSPDGTQVAFIRCKAQREMIAVAAASGGIARLLDPGERTLNDIDWAQDGSGVLFLSTDGLWHLPISGGEPRREVSGIHLMGASFAVARNKSILAYSAFTDERNIWEFAPDQDPSAPHPVISSSRYDARPAYSADGRRIAFVSNRTGFRQVWVADSDGSAPRQLTHFNGCLLLDPSWSPDGRHLVFTAFPSGWANLCLIDVQTGVMQVLDVSLSYDIWPSWSADGEWIYFTSTRSGDAEIWKLSPSGGEPEQVSFDGGYKGMESADGATLYFMKSFRDSVGVWSQPTSGGPAELALSLPSGRLSDWDLGDDGIYYCYAKEKPDQRYHVAWHDFDSSDEDRILFETNSKICPHLDVHPDGRRLIFDRTSRFEGDIVAYGEF